MGQDRSSRILEEPEIVRERPRADLRALVIDYVGYRECAPAPRARRELPVPFVPLIINFGARWRIGPPGAVAERGSFAAGLSVVPTVVESMGAAHCLQINFTPVGASRVFRMPLSELTDRVVDLEEVPALGMPWRALRGRLIEAPSWPSRFALIDDLIAGRVGRGRAPPDAVVWAAERLSRHAGLCRIDELAREIGWSRRHFSALFRRDIGLGPKTFARLLRFNRVLELIGERPPLDWAGLAAEAGYADQSHLIRECVGFSGLTPSALVDRNLAGAGVDERLA